MDVCVGVYVCVCGYVYACVKYTLYIFICKDF